MRLAFIFILSLVFSEGEEKDDGMRREWCGHENCYNILGLVRDADPKSIKDRYRQLSREKHPDKCPDCDPKDIQKINRAYEILSKPKTRALYDTVMKRKAQASAPKESTFMAVAIILLIFITCYHQVQKQKQDQAREKILSMRQVRIAIKKNHPELFEENSSSSKKKKKKKSARERKEFEEAAYKRISHKDLLKVITELNYPPGEYTGEYISWLGTCEYVLTYPLKLCSKSSNLETVNKKSD